MRLIDADALIKYLDDNRIPSNIDAINKQPTVDAVPVVRCIEYKHDGISGVTSFSMYQRELYISYENNEGLFRDVPDDVYCYCGEKVTES